MPKSPFFSWREAILYSELPATTRHVLLTLSCHMNELGESCFPSIDRLCLETNLSRPSVIKHLGIAKDMGWIRVSLHGYGGQNWRSHEYSIGWPEGGKGDLPASGKVVNLVSEGGKPDTQKVVKEVNPSTSVSTSVSTSSGAARPWDLLVAKGVSRRYLGKLAKEHGTEKMDQAVSETLRIDPAEPGAYLTKLLKDGISEIEIPPLDDHKAIDRLGKKLRIMPKRDENYYQFRQRLIEAQKNA